MNDTISRQVAIKYLCEKGMCGDKQCDIYPCKDVRAIEQVPTIDPVKRGKWKCFIETGSGLYDSIDIPRAECSECGFKVPEEWGGWFKFCPNCGARMEAEE